MPWCRRNNPSNKCFSRQELPSKQTAWEAIFASKLGNIAVI